MSKKSGLDRWFDEKWTKKTKQGEVPCGSDKGKDDAKCRPSKRVNSKTPVTWDEMSESQKKRARAEKNKANKKGKQFSGLEFKKIKDKVKSKKTKDR